MLTQRLKIWNRLMSEVFGIPLKSPGSRVLAHGPCGRGFHAGDMDEAQGHGKPSHFLAW